MPLEATVLVLDNSAYALDGDYAPTRWSAQVDAANVLFTTKTNANPESVVGLMTMAGSNPKVLVTPTTDGGKITAGVHGVPLEGDADLHTGIQIAQLALKHRQNKNQKQRIIAFVGSPLTANNCTKEALIKLGKKMKKNNVAIDIVSFGEVEENQEALNALIEAVNSSDNSHIISVPPTLERVLSDAVLSSPILAEEQSSMGMGSSGSNQAGTSSAAANGDGEFGVDPNLDPELAMALRMSLEDERARQAAANNASNAASQSASTATPSEPSTASEVAQQPSDVQPFEPSSEILPRNPTQPIVDPSLMNPETQPLLSAQDGDVDMDAEEDEDEELQRALAMSRGDDVDMSANDDDTDEEEEIRKAIALSLQGEQGDTKKPQ